MRTPRWIRSIKVLFNTSCWDRLYGYNNKWDVELRELMKYNRFEPLFRSGRLDHHQCKLGGKVIWIANHPYASYTLRGRVGDCPIGRYSVTHMASRLTVLEANTQRLEDYRYWEERQLIDTRLVNGDGITPKKIELKNELLGWS